MRNKESVGKNSAYSIGFRVGTTLALALPHVLAACDGVEVDPEAERAALTQMAQARETASTADLPDPVVEKTQLSTQVPPELELIVTPERPEIVSGEGGPYTPEQWDLIYVQEKFKDQEEQNTRWVVDYWGKAQNRPFNPESFDLDLNFKYLFDINNPEEAIVLLEAGGSDYQGATFTQPVDVVKGEFMQEPPPAPEGDFLIPPGLGPLEVSGGNEGLILANVDGKLSRINQQGEVVQLINSEGQWEYVTASPEVIEEIQERTNALGDRFSLQEEEGKYYLVKDEESRVGYFDREGDFVIQLPQSGVKEFDLKNENVKLDAFEGSEASERWVVVDEKEEDGKNYRYINREGKEWEKWYTGVDEIVSPGGVKFSIGKNELGVHFVDATLLEYLHYYAMAQIDLNEQPPSKTNSSITAAWYSENKTVRDMWRVKRNPTYDKNGYISAVAERVDEPVVPNVVIIDFLKYSNAMDSNMLSGASKDSTYGGFRVNLADCNVEEACWNYTLIAHGERESYASKYPQAIINQSPDIFERGFKRGLMDEQSIIVAAMGQAIVDSKMEELGKNNEYYFLDDDMFVLNRWGTTLNDRLYYQDMFMYAYHNFERPFDPERVE